MRFIIVASLVTIMGIVGAYYSPPKRQEPAMVGDVFFVGFVLGTILIVLFAP